jgi:hypothetical protein
MKYLTLALFLFCIYTTATSQSAKALFDAEKIVFYGLDFSKAKFALPDAKPNEIKDRYFDEWHQGVMTDNARFNKESAFQKISVFGDPFVAKKRNAAVNVADIITKDDNPLSAADIESVIAEYKDGLKKEGFGAVLVVESFNKKKEEGIAHVVLFDIAKRKVIIDKRMVGKPGGGGLTNYWLRSVQNMFERMTATEFSLWKKEALSK